MSFGIYSSDPKIKVYISTISANKEIRQKQQRILQVLEARRIPHEALDIAKNNVAKRDLRLYLGQNAAPPQIFNRDLHCGDYQSFYYAVEDEKVEEFLKMKDPEKPKPKEEDPYAAAAAAAAAIGAKKSFVRSTVDDSATAVASVDKNATDSASSVAKDDADSAASTVAKDATDSTSTAVAKGDADSTPSTTNVAHESDDSDDDDDDDDDDDEVDDDEDDEDSSQKSSTPPLSTTAAPSTVTASPAVPPPPPPPPAAAPPPPPPPPPAPPKKGLKA